MSDVQFRLEPWFIGQWLLPLILTLPAVFALPAILMPPIMWGALVAACALALAGAVFGVLEGRRCVALNGGLTIAWRTRKRNWALAEIEEIMIWHGLNGRPGSLTVRTGRGEWHIQLYSYRVRDIKRLMEAVEKQGITIQRVSGLRATALAG